jgi:hypothetical protein
VSPATVIPAVVAGLEILDGWMERARARELAEAERAAAELAALHAQMVASPFYIGKDDA